MALTPQRNPLPNLKQNTGVSGTTANPGSITTKDGLVTNVTPGAASAGGGGAGGGGASPTITALPPLSYVNGTLTIAEATPTSDGVVELAGDLGGTATSPLVTGLQGFPVAVTAPASGQVPTWNGSEYTPQTPGGGGTPLRVYPITRPTLSDFTPTNLGGSDTYGTYSDGSIYLTCAVVASVNARMLLKPYTIPSAGHTHTLIMAMQNAAFNENYFEQGIVLYATGSGKFSWFGIRGSTDSISVTFGMAWEEWNNFTSPAATELTNRKTVYRSEGLWIKMFDDGTNQSMYSSPDGESWLLHGTAGSTSWNTADQIGIYNMPLDNANLAPGAFQTIIVPSWLETTT